MGAVGRVREGVDTKSLWDHPFITNTNLSEKLIFLTP